MYTKVKALVAMMRGRRGGGTSDAPYIKGRNSMGVHEFLLHTCNSVADRLPEDVHDLITGQASCGDIHDIDWETLDVFS